MVPKHIQGRMAPLATNARARQRQTKTQQIEDKNDLIAQKTEDYPDLRKRPSHMVKPTGGPRVLHSKATKATEDIDQLHLDIDRLESEIKVGRALHVALTCSFF